MTAMKTGRKQIQIIVIILLCIISATGLFVWQKQNTTPSSAKKGSNTTRSSQAMEGIVTNQWYSSLFFHQWSEQMFAFPLAYKLSDSGVGISYPRVNATDKTVFGSYVEDLVVSLPSTLTKKTVIDPDMVGVGLELCSSESCATTRLTHGVPMTVFEVAKETTLTVAALSSTDIQHSAEASTITFPHGKYLVTVRGADERSLDGIRVQDAKRLTFSLQPSDQLIIFLQPDEATLSADQIGGIVTGTEFEYVEKDQKISASLQYLTKDTQSTSLLALLPHHWQHRTEQPLGTYRTLRGTMKLYQTTSIETTYEVPEPLTVSEMVKSLSEEEKNTLRALLEQDTKIITQIPVPTPVYENGKHVFKMAQLLEISTALEAPESSQALRAKLTDVLLDWLGDEPSSAGSPLAYSDSPKGLIATQPVTQFGNEQFNDHHFHYGYYIAASGILLGSVDVAEREQLYTQLKPGLEAMLKDVANLDIENGYPLLRNFDPYESHSWADGRALAGDGNNQESTSEAIHRWYGIHRLGEALGRDELTELGQVGWAMEREAAQIYWLGQKPELFAFPEGYKQPIASLVWGGKYDFSTWFSGQPTHIYGIQFLPMSPAMTHVIDPETWAKYQSYGPSEDKEAWNDIYAMVAVANGQKTMNGESITTTLPKYETGNSASWYFLWTSYWLKQ